MKFPMRTAVRVGRVDLIVSTTDVGSYFETMIFRKDDRLFEQGSFQTSRWEGTEHAQEAHEKIVNLMRLMGSVRKTLSPEAAEAFDEMVLTRFDPASRSGY